jgi:hypothetical protein
MKLFQQLMGRTALHFEMTPGITNPAIAVEHLVKMGYARIYLVAAGDDRVPGFQKMMQSIKRSPLGSKIKDLQVISSDVPGAARVKGISGTAARAAAVSGDLEAFTYVVGPQNPMAAEQIYHQLRKFMGIHESAAKFIADRWKQGKPLVTERFDQSALDSVWSRKNDDQQRRSVSTVDAWERSRLAKLQAQYDRIKQLHFAGRHKGADELQRKLNSTR